MAKKILLIILIFILWGLFVNGVKIFIQKAPLTANYLFNASEDKKINADKQNINDNINNSSEDPLGVAFPKNNKTNIPQNLNTSVKNPIVKTSESLVNDNSERINSQPEVESLKIDPQKTILENYFLALSRVHLPEPRLTADAITLHLRGENRGLEVIIALLKESNNKIYQITPPEEAQNIHKNNLWTVNKLVDALEKILDKTGNQKEFDELMQKLEPEIEETQKVISESNQETMSLVAKYNLDDSFLK